MIALSHAIDWQQPWLAPYRELGLAVAAGLEHSECVADALERLAVDAAPMLDAGRLRFVTHDALPEGEAYEAFIHRSACVPTRDNLHDLFNGLVWLRWPALKRRLNELQAAQIAQHGIGPQRGALRDALTLFDENGALWPAPPALAQALRERAWHRAFVTLRHLWVDAQPCLFGHALLEKLVHPRKPITAHACVLPQPAWATREGVNGIDPSWLARKPFIPMPVLGVPGWWPANEACGFYEDAKVFRRHP